jgi:hypothetical protein|tara:strand:- start:68 stop:670 length:603 start_codon:yes stop_codon:yes gene_type:complete
MKKQRVTYRNLSDLAESYGLQFYQSAPITGGGYSSYEYYLEASVELNKWIRKNYKIKIDRRNTGMWNYTFEYVIVNLNDEARDNPYFVDREETTLRYTNNEQHYKEKFKYALKRTQNRDWNGQEISRLTDLTWEEWNNRFAKVILKNYSDNPKDLVNPIVKVKDYHNKVGQFNKPFLSLGNKRKKLASYYEQENGKNKKR